MINSLHSKLATWYGKIHGVKRKPVSGSAPPRPIRVFFSHHVFFRIRSLTYYVTNNMTSRKARCFRAIFARNLLKIHTFFMKYWYFSKISCDKKNLKRIFISYSIYETRCVFSIPSPEARGYKTHNSFHKYRMKWKFISDPIYIYIYISSCSPSLIIWIDFFFQRNSTSRLKTMCHSAPLSRLKGGLKLT